MLLAKDLGQSSKAERIQSPSAQFTYGLGFEPTKEDKRQAIEKKNAKKLARLRGKELPDSKLSVPHLRTIFPRPSYILNPEQTQSTNLEVSACVSVGSTPPFSQTLDLPAPEAEVFTISGSTSQPSPPSPYPGNGELRNWEVLPLVTRASTTVS